MASLVPRYYYNGSLLYERLVLQGKILKSPDSERCWYMPLVPVHKIDIIVGELALANPEDYKLMKYYKPDNRTKYDVDKLRVGMRIHTSPLQSSLYTTLALHVNSVELLVHHYNTQQKYVDEFKVLFMPKRVISDM